MEDWLVSGKTCFKCHTFKPLDDFYTHPQMGDGHLNKCKECTKRDTKESYRADPIKHAEYERKRTQQPYRKAKALEYQRTRRARHPEKNAARQAVNNAIRDGRLIRQSCEVCGETDIEAHHEDYSKPLDVRWLCFRHHREEHGQSVISIQKAAP
jgi:ribosomal protein S27AE